MSQESLIVLSLLIGGIDYGPFPSSTIHLIAILPANSSETAFGMIIHEDEVVENPETFSVSMRLLSDGGFNPFGGGSVSTPQPGATSETVVVIQDNDCKMILVVHGWGNSSSCGGSYYDNVMTDNEAGQEKAVVMSIVISLQLSESHLNLTLSKYWNLRRIGN